MSDVSRHFFGQMPEMPYKVGQEVERKPDLDLESAPSPIHVAHVVREGFCCCTVFSGALITCAWCPIHGTESTHVV